MKRLHVPEVNARYWTAITLASVFGTNMGDFYAHQSRLGIVNGLAVLGALVAAVFFVERFDVRRHETYYWLVIVLIRTGATNIADFLAYHVRVPSLALSLGLIAFLCGVGFSLSTLLTCVAFRATLMLWRQRAPHLGSAVQPAHS